MQITVHLNGAAYTALLDQALDLSLPIDPNGEHPRFFCGEHASAEALKIGSFIGDIHAGGSVNAQTLQIVPHCHGTHSECVGHVIGSALPVLRQIKAGLMPALLHTVECVFSTETQERYILDSNSDEPLITRAALPDKQALIGAEALIIRTTPNSTSKRTRNYSQHPNYPVLTCEAIEYLANTDLQHLLLDTPSFDRADDGGRVYNHKTWWGVGADENIRWPQRGLTEMIFADDSITDGWYLLDLHLSPLISDAVPSRPLLYPLTLQSS